MTQTPTTDTLAHDWDKRNWDKHNWDKHNSDQHKWDENALGNFDKQGRTNGKITRRVI